MYYELYIDVFFLENFMMDALLLMLTGRMIRCQAGKGRIFLGAALGAFLTCGAVLIPVPYLLIRLILFYGGINLLMLKVCFRWEEPWEWSGRIWETWGCFSFWRFSFI